MKRYRVNLEHRTVREGSVIIHAADDSEACELATQYAADGMVSTVVVHEEKRAEATEEPG